MSFCKYAEKRGHEYYCLGTREIDICPCRAVPYSNKCYNPQNRDKEIHFYSAEAYVINKRIPMYYRSWEATETAVSEGEAIIHTLQMGLLSYSSNLFELGYRIFIYDENGEFELTIGDCVRTNREIRIEHNHFKMWLSGEFTNYEKI